MKTLLIAALSLAAFAAMAQDRADIDRTKIIGNRELPKVLYIVPWKKPLPGTLSGRPVNSVLDEALAPVDREVFRRQVDYGVQVQVQVQARTTAKSSSTTTTASTAPDGAPR